MRTHFLFPTHPLKPTVVEPMFADQLAILHEAGFSASLCPDAVIQQGKPLRNIPAGATIVYRGWMLATLEYEQLFKAIGAAAASALTSPIAYLATHHLPKIAGLPVRPEACQGDRRRPINFRNSCHQTRFSSVLRS